MDLYRFLTRGMPWWAAGHSIYAYREFIEHVSKGEDVRLRSPRGEGHPGVCDLVDVPCSSSTHVGQRRSLQRTRVVLSNPLQGSARRFPLRHKFCRWLSVLDMIFFFLFLRAHLLGIECEIKKFQEVNLRRLQTLLQALSCEDRP